MNSRPTVPIYVGIFTVLGAALVMFVALRARADDVIASPRRLVVDFKEAKGLAIGAEVRYLGVRIGTVERIALTERDGRAMARVQMKVTSAVDVREDSEVIIEAATLLGNHMVSIRSGSLDSPPASDARPLLGGEQADLNEVIAEVRDGIASVRKLAENLDEGQGDLFRTIEDVIAENRDNLKQATDSLAEVGPKLEEIVNKVQRFVDDADSEDSTLGRLLSDKETFGRIEKIAADLEKITDQIAKGEGTVGKLIFTEEGLTDIKDSLEEVKTAFNDIRTLLEDNKDGLTDAINGFKDVGPAVDKAAKNLEEITEKINAGEGTLARVLNDPSLYDEAKSAFTQIQQTFEEAEEQTVLQSFLRIFTGAI